MLPPPTDSAPALKPRTGALAQDVHRPAAARSQVHALPLVRPSKDAGAVGPFLGLKTVVVELSFQYHNNAVVEPDPLAYATVSGRGWDPQENVDAPVLKSGHGRLGPGSRSDYEPAEAGSVGVGRCV